MFRKGLFLAAMCLLPAMAQAQARGPFELTLGGTGSNGSKFNGVSASGNASLGYYFGENLEVAVRQALTYTDLAGKALDGSTAIGLDLHFPLGDQGQFVPYVGGDIGYVYGDGLHDTFEGGPEAGMKIYVNSTTFIYGSAQYQIFFDKHSSHTVLSEGQFLYGVGIGFRF